ncbi:hypothetical protein C6Y45_12675 [Alkalicoccus saliphilus]|jgi:hypothetical protein|uniref:Uncharacterized protein n=1 Tax=Alkalicoccus saliphilus TaxID=200989 RepID=A0A2T4U412_9BACI|nr:hypothetical protein C6Y45_12675 [Alkalicoccus saliphilus]
MELAEAGPLGKPLHGNESGRSFFYFQGSLQENRCFLTAPDAGYILKSLRAFSVVKAAVSS